ncbi:MAG: hypothetical protein ACFFAH_02250 [Promethearchaeota archaeon]
MKNIKKDLIHLINQKLNQNQLPDLEWLESILSTTKLDNSKELKTLISCIKKFITKIQNPTFSNIRITKLGSNFEQAYNLLKKFFNSDVLDPKELYTERMELLGKYPDKFPLFMTARIISLPGEIVVNSEGFLNLVDCNKNRETNLLICVVSGNYIPLRGKFIGSGFGAIGHALTVKTFRNKGNATALMDYTIDLMTKFAENRREKYLLTLLEAEKQSRTFWIKNGFRWPKDIEYFQPPLIFDENNGKPVFKEVKETLMIKYPKKSIKKDLLIEIITTLYRAWILSSYTDLPSEVFEKIQFYVMDYILKNFVEQKAMSGNENILLTFPDIT